MDTLMTRTMGRGEFLRAAVLLVGGTLLDLAIPRGRARAAERSASLMDGKMTGEETDKDLFRSPGGLCHDGKSLQVGEGVAGSAYPRTVPGHPKEGNGKGVYRQILELPRERNLPVRVLWNGPVPFGDQVRFRNGMAKLLCADRQGEYPHRERHELVREKDRGPLRTVRRPPGPRVRGRTETDRPSLLHELGGPYVRETGGEGIFRGYVLRGLIRRRESGPGGAARSEKSGKRIPRCQGDQHGYLRPRGGHGGKDGGSPDPGGNLSGDSEVMERGTL